MGWRHVPRRHKNTPHWNYNTKSVNIQTSLHSHIQSRCALTRITEIARFGIMYCLNVTHYHQEVSGQCLLHLHPKYTSDAGPFNPSAFRQSSRPLMTTEQVLACNDEQQFYTNSLRGYGNILTSMGIDVTRPTPTCLS